MDTMKCWCLPDAHRVLASHCSSCYSSLKLPSLEYLFRADGWGKKNNNDSIYTDRIDRNRKEKRALGQWEDYFNWFPLWNTSVPNIQTSWYLWQICFWFTNKVTSSPSPGLKQQHTQSPGSLDTGVIRPAVCVEKSRQWVKFSFFLMPRCPTVSNNEQNTSSGYKLQMAVRAITQNSSFLIHQWGCDLVQLINQSWSASVNGPEFIF